MTTLSFLSAIGEHLRLVRLGRSTLRGVLVLFAVCVALTAARAEEGLVAHYSFDEGAGVTAGDSSGNGNDGAIKGAVWVKSPKGGALRFNGQDAFVDCGRAPARALAGDYTLSAWVRLSLPVVTPNYNTNWTIFSSEAYPGSGVLLRLGGTDGKL